MVKKIPKSKQEKTKNHSILDYFPLSSSKGKIKAPSSEYSGENKITVEVEKIIRKIKTSQRKITRILKKKSSPKKKDSINESNSSINKSISSLNDSSSSIDLNPETKYQGIRE